MESLNRFVRSLGVARLVVFVAVIFAAIAFFAWLLTRLTEDHPALLFGDMEMGDAAKVVSELENMGVPYTLGTGGTSVFVASDDVPRLRVALAEKGLPGGASLGYEIFDSTDALGQTSFQQNVNLVRALEGELARTIRAIGSVQGARVHLVLPKRELFSREAQKPSASVLLQMRGSARLSPEQVEGVQHLIAAAVPGLVPEEISIVDGRGTLVSGRYGGEGADALFSSRADERRHKLEADLNHTIEELVERTVGPGKVRAEVHAEMDFDRINSSEERYDPDGQVVRSTQSVTQQGTTSDGSENQPVGVATNLPDATGASGSGSTSRSAENRNEETVNYEISKKTINHVREAGVVRRLSVAVLVDGTYGPDANGTSNYQPRSSKEIEQLTTLVQSAIGYDANRGDVVEVINMRFAEPEVVNDESFNLLFGLAKNDLFRLAQYLALTIVSLLILLFVVRPIVSRTLEALPRPEMMPAGPLLTAAGAAGATPGAPGAPVALPAGASGEDTIAGLLPETEEMVNIARIDGRVKASSIRRMGEIVDKHPDESLAIVRNWLHTEE